MHIFHNAAHVWKTGGYFFSTSYIMSGALYYGLYYPEMLVPWVQQKRPPGPPKYDFFFGSSYLDLNFKSYRIALLFDIYIDMSERIVGKQDRPSLIIEGPPGPPKGWTGKDGSPSPTFPSI